MLGNLSLRFISRCDWVVMKFELLRLHGNRMTVGQQRDRLRRRTGRERECGSSVNSICDSSIIYPTPIFPRYVQAYQLGAVFNTQELSDNVPLWQSPNRRSRMPAARRAAILCRSGLWIILAVVQDWTDKPPRVKA